MRPARVLAAAAVAALAASPAAARQGTLQALVDAADDGSVVRVPAGRYVGPVRIDRPVELRADGDVVIDGGGEGDVVQIAAPDVTLHGLEIRGTGISLDRENAGIVVTAPRATIESCVLEDVLFGIYGKEADGCVVRDNRIGGKELPEPRRGDAIRLWESPGSVIEGNVVHRSRDVIMWFSDDVVLRANRVTGGRYGMHFMYSDRNVLEDNVLTDNSVGAFLMYSSDLTLRRNVCARNRGPSGFGIGLKELDGLLAEDNLIVGNRVGLHLDNSPSVIGVQHVLRRNVIAYNDVGIGFLPMVRHNRFTENTFLENLEQVSILGAGRLRDNDFAVDGRGNYWSDYRGFDLDDDGVGDIEYRADALFENLVDRDPRMRLFLFSPAEDAVSMAARAFPVVAPRPKVTDPAPLVAPVHARRDADAPGDPWDGVGWAGALLAVAALCLVPALRPERLEPSATGAEEVEA